MRHSRLPHLCHICTLTGLASAICSFTWIWLCHASTRARCSGQIPAWRKDKDLAAPLIESYVFAAPSYDELKEWVRPDLLLSTTEGT